MIIEESDLIEEKRRPWGVVYANINIMKGLLSGEPFKLEYPIIIVSVMHDFNTLSYKHHTSIFYRKGDGINSFTEAAPKETRSLPITMNIQESIKKCAEKIGFNPFETK